MDFQIVPLHYQYAWPIVLLAHYSIKESFMCLNWNHLAIEMYAIASIRQELERALEHNAVTCLMAGRNCSWCHKLEKTTTIPKNQRKGNSCSLAVTAHISSYQKSPFLANDLSDRWEKVPNHLRAICRQL